MNTENLLLWITLAFRLNRDSTIFVGALILKAEKVFAVAAAANILYPPPPTFNKGITVIISGMHANITSDLYR